MAGFPEHGGAGGDPGPSGVLPGFWEALRRDLSFMPECGGYHGNVFEGTAGTGAGHELKASKRKNQEGLRESARTVLAFSFGRSLFLIKHS